MNDALDELAAELAAGNEPAQPAEQAANVDESKSEQVRGPDGKFTKAETADDGEGAVRDDEAEEAPAQEGEGEESSEQEDQGDEQPRKRRGARERIEQLTAQKNEERAKAEYWQRKATELAKNLEQPLDPDLEFTDPAAWNQAQLNRTLDEREARAAYHQAQAAREAELNNAAQTFYARVEDAREAMPDFDQVFHNQLPVTEAAIEYLGESENGPAIAYHLGKNPQEAARIASLPLAQQYAALARIDARVSMPKGRKTTTAPKPTPTVTGAAAGGSSFDPASASIDDVAKQLGY